MENGGFHLQYGGTPVKDKLHDGAKALIRCDQGYAPLEHHKEFTCNATDPNPEYPVCVLGEFTLYFLNLKKMGESILLISFLNQRKFSFEHSSSIVKCYSLHFATDHVETGKHMPSSFNYANDNNNALSTGGVCRNRDDRFPGRDERSP